MIPRIESSFGASLSQEIENLLTSTSSLLEENFGFLKNRLESLESKFQEVIGEISSQKHLEIQRLQN